MKGFFMVRFRAMTPQDGCVWITGASSGIGRDLALELCRAGWTVAATARRRDALKDLQDESTQLSGTLDIFPADITNRGEVESTIREIQSKSGPIGMAILNAGIYLPVEAANLVKHYDDFERSFDVNLMGTINCLGPVIKQMKQEGRGQIAIVSSATGFGGLPSCAAYGATKAALINLAECLAIELKPLGIQTTIVTPGFVDTPAQDDLNFPKPFMVTSPQAAKRIVDGLKTPRFEITFPRRFTWGLKAFNNFVPKNIYLHLVRKQTMP
jgi:NAD(P)-dependent dehydrogenase (short-subunit alcohol dehydrogenase family)